MTPAIRWPCSRVARCSSAASVGPTCWAGPGPTSWPRSPVPVDAPTRSVSCPRGHRLSDPGAGPSAWPATPTAPRTATRGSRAGTRPSPPRTWRRSRPTRRWAHAVPGSRTAGIAATTGGGPRLRDAAPAAASSSPLEASCADACVGRRRVAHRRARPLGRGGHVTGRTSSWPHLVRRHGLAAALRAAIGPAELRQRGRSWRSRLDHVMAHAAHGSRPAARQGAG